MNRILRKLTNTSFFIALCAALAMTSMLSSPGYAHHSFAMYDTTESINFTGKLLRFIPGANHAQILFEIIDDKGDLILAENGKPLVWGLETGSSSMIARQGVTVAAFPEGTIVNFSINPLRNGKPFGLQDGSIVSCGSEFPAEGCNEDTGEVFMKRQLFGPPPK